MSEIPSDILSVINTTAQGEWPDDRDIGCATPESKAYTAQSVLGECLQGKKSIPRLRAHAAVPQIFLHRTYTGKNH